MAIQGGRQSFRTGPFGGIFRMALFFLVALHAWRASLVVKLTVAANSPVFVCGFADCGILSKFRNNAIPELMFD